MKIKDFFHTRIVYLLLIFFIFWAPSMLAIETMAVGQVLNKMDKMPIAGVNIYFKNTSKGVHSNDEGYFKISTSGVETTLVFSCIGYIEREIKLKLDKSVGLEVAMEEENTLLQEIFIIPGSNPALDWIKKIRLSRSQNDLTRQPGFYAQSIEQNLVLLSKVNRKSMDKKLFEQLKKATLQHTDTALVLPLYMSENTFSISSKDKKLIKKDVFSTPAMGDKIISQLVGEIETEINFYNNSITIFGKSFVSPLSNISNSYYRYYLTDSINAVSGKQYNIRFVSRNPKNLAFNGSFLFDSTTLSIAKIEAELPLTANINFIENLRIFQQFEQLPNRRWTRSFEEVMFNTPFEILSDSIRPKPEIFVKRTANYSINDSIRMLPDSFANTEYTQITLDQKLSELNNTPILRTAKWIADVVFTGYLNLGKVDLGKVQQIARLTGREGLRLNVPLRTNENLWKNVSIGGYAGYASRSKEIKYSVGGEYRLPGVSRNKIAVNYTDDYRIVNYNYSNFNYLENPLLSGDIDIANTLFSFGSASNLNHRKEFLVSYYHDWNADIETNTFLRSNSIIGNDKLQLNNSFGNDLTLQYQSATIETRISFAERTYEDHLQRIYINNNRPVLYGVFEFGSYHIGNENGNFHKLSLLVKQKLQFGVGEFKYIAEGGVIAGKVPYPLLHLPFGNNTGGYSFQNFNLMSYMEYATDKYLTLHSELIFNGLILNQIPLVKKLNLREICSFHFASGGLSNTHSSVLNIPNTTQPLYRPYIEVGVGVANLFHLITVQSVWRLSDLNKQNVIPFNIMLSINVGF